MGNAVATLHFQTLHQHPSLKCFVQEESKSGNRSHRIKANTIFRGQEYAYVDSDIFITLQLVCVRIISGDWLVEVSL